jgi:hypothetical protein
VNLSCYITLGVHKKIGQSTVPPLHYSLQAGRDICHDALKNKYCNISQTQIQTYCDFCDTCQLKKSKVKKSIVVKVG